MVNAPRFTRNMEVPVVATARSLGATGTDLLPEHGLFKFLLEQRETNLTELENAWTSARDNNKHLSLTFSPLKLTIDITT